MTDPTGASYDRVAEKYATEIGDELSSRPLERGLLGAFVALLGPGGTVADVGCGPGHVTAFLSEAGLAARGLDISLRMVEIAAARVPGVPFVAGTMLALPYEDAELDGAIAWFSVIHLPDADRPRAYEELARVVRPGGWLLLGFHVSDDSAGGVHSAGDVSHVTTWWDQPVELAFHFLDPANETALLVAAGWRPTATMEREPMVPTEAQTRRCYLLVQRG